MVMFSFIVDAFDSTVPMIDSSIHRCLSWILCISRVDGSLKRRTQTSVPRGTANTTGTKADGFWQLLRSDLAPPNESHSPV